MSKRFVGLDYANMHTRVCRSCHYELPTAHFASHKTTECIICASARRVARVWTVADIDRVLRAGRAIMNLWPRYLETWTEEDLVLWRELVSALDRGQSIGEYEEDRSDAEERSADGGRREDADASPGGGDRGADGKDRRRSRKQQHARGAKDGGRAADAVRVSVSDASASAADDPDDEQVPG